MLGLDGGGDVSLPALELADRPVVIVVGSEGKGLSRLVTETCDQIVSIPIDAATESLNAGIAASVALYQVSTLRAQPTADVVGSCAGMNHRARGAWLLDDTRRKEHHGSHRRHRRHRLRRPPHRRRGGEPRPHGRLRRAHGSGRARRGCDLHRGHAARCRRASSPSSRASTSSSRPSPARGDMLGNVRPEHRRARRPRCRRTCASASSAAPAAASSPRAAPRLVDQASFTEEYKPEALEAIGILEDLAGDRRRRTTGSTSTRPAASAPGTRGSAPARYRDGGDVIVTDAEGESYISGADLARRGRRRDREPEALARAVHRRVLDRHLRVTQTRSAPVDAVGLVVLTTGMSAVMTGSDTVSVGGPIRVASSRRWRSTSSM